MGLKNFSQNIEIWGGAECTINRIGDRYYDQLEKSGHYARIGDLDSFAALGIQAIRFPILWERVAPCGLERADWSWTNKFLKRLRELRIRPIAGLLHHGSGPPETSLVDANFAEKFAAYASAVARRYPWIDAYTPINEPLTTARFSGLYGFWYPHGKDDRTFAAALVNQCRASILAMRAIRRENPHAKFIQTEDLGKTYSTPKLNYQAQFENERRWLAFDLLRGQVSDEHPLYNYLLDAGVKNSQIEWFSENACSPDVLGFNYYPTSERFLDENTKHYPVCSIGGNGREQYADIEAVRVKIESPTGLRVLLNEAWERFKTPLAITEVHLGCTREEQLRWFLETWKTANLLNGEGVDLRAVTAWALLGSFDWNSLLTVSANHYEPGVFDVRGEKPRPTALADLIKNIARNKNFHHPVTENPGWWKRPSRFLIQSNSEKKNGQSNKSGAKKLLITGATGTLGQAFARVCRERELSFQLLSRQEMDIADEKSVALAVKKFQPWAIINAAGFVRVDAAECESENCFRENTKGAINLASICSGNKISFMTFSSDLIFDGNKKRPYVETDSPNPLNVYGQSKAEAEKRILEINADSLIIRTAAFFSPWDEYNFPSVVLRSLARGESFKAAADNFVSPTYLPDLVNACLDILIDGENGLWHLANQGEISWADFARQAAKMARLDSTLVIDCHAAELNFHAPRPAYSALGSERGILLPDLEKSLDRYVRAVKNEL